MKTREEQLAYNRESQRLYRLRHPEKVKARKAAYYKSDRGRQKLAESGARFRAAHPEYEQKRHREYNQTVGKTPLGRARRYLIQVATIGNPTTSTVEEALWFFEHKPELCECCGKEPAKHLDHKHGGKIRGWLCHACNVGLGFIEKEPFHGQALEYLEKHTANAVTT